MAHRDERDHRPLKANSTAKPRMLREGSIAFPYLCVAAGVLADGRKAQWVSKGSLELRIRPEAPVAYSNTCESSQGPQAMSERNRGSEFVIRDVEGVLFEEVLKPFARRFPGELLQASLTMDEFADALSWRASRYGDYPGPGDHPFDTRPTVTETTLGRFLPWRWQHDQVWPSRKAMEEAGHVIAHDNEEGTHAWVTGRYAQLYTVIGGLISKRCTEPTWKVEADPKGQVWMGLVRDGSLPDTPSVNNPARAFFPASRHDEAAAFARKLARDTRGRLTLAGDAGRSLLVRSDGTNLASLLSTVCAVERLAELLSKSKGEPALPIQVVASLSKLQAAAEALRRVPIETMAPREREKAVDDVMFDFLPVWRDIEPHLRATDIAILRKSASGLGTSAAVRWTNRYTPLLAMLERVTGLGGRSVGAPVSATQERWEGICRVEPSNVDILTKCHAILAYGLEQVAPHDERFGEAAKAAGKAYGTFARSPEAATWSTLLDCLQSLVSTQPDRYPTEGVAGKWAFTKREALRHLVERLGDLDPFGVGPGLDRSRP